jgi:hypothetical protein
MGANTMCMHLAIKLVVVQKGVTFSCVGTKQYNKRESLSAALAAG